MTNELSCYEQAVRKAGEREAVPAPAPVQDGDPPALVMSGEDFYRAACVEAHTRLKPASVKLNRENSAAVTRTPHNVGR
jgi:hypothetical protein